jgi:uncharacterized protein (DUF1800 family)
MALAAAPAGMNTAPAPGADWRLLAGEGYPFSVATSTTVRFGAPEAGWVDKVVSGTVMCSNAAFSFSPLPVGYRFCYAAPVSAAPPPVPTPSPAPPVPAPAPKPAVAPGPISDAQRLADQASFGPTEALIAEINTSGAQAWVAAQINMPQRSRYTSGMDNSIHQNAKESDAFCQGKGINCWRDYYSAEPLLWDFYRNAMTQPDQLRQRVAFALQQLVVVNDSEVNGTYGLRSYYNSLLDLSFKNYRDVLKKVTLSPVMGDFLNHVNNNRSAPNENYAREMLQLFAIGTCELNADGTLKTGGCIPTYNNENVRAYAYALTGWTYPAGGSSVDGCWPAGANCRYYAGDMLPLSSYHDTEPRKLLSGVNLPAGHTAPEALEKVLDSIMTHPNTGPFIAKHLIQHLVSSNPSPAYIQRVTGAFRSGRFGDFGTDQMGDLAATVAAVLLDPEARTVTASRSAGKLREPALMFTGILRALNGKTDGDTLSWNWGQRLRQHLFRPPSVFNFYPPDYPVSGTNLVGPSFALHDISTSLERLNFLGSMIDWREEKANNSVPGATGTYINLEAFASDVDDASKLLDRFSALALGQALQGPAREAALKAVAWWTPETSRDWRSYRLNTAAYLVFASPQYQVQR